MLSWRKPELGDVIHAQTQIHSHTQIHTHTPCSATGICTTKCEVTMKHRGITVLQDYYYNYHCIIIMINNIHKYWILHWTHTFVLNPVVIWISNNTIVWMNTSIQIFDWGLSNQQGLWVSNQYTSNCFEVTPLGQATSSSGDGFICHVNYIFV